MARLEIYGAFSYNTKGFGSNTDAEAGGRSCRRRLLMNWIRKEIADLAAYVPGRQPSGPIVKLNANENPYPPAPGVQQALARLDAEALRLYPNATADGLREKAAAVFGVAREEVIAGNGSDDILNMIVRAFLDPGERVAVTDPTYTLYETLAAIQGAQVQVHPLTPAYELPETIIGAAVKVTFLANPNAQTGTLFPLAALRRVCGAAAGIVVIDEAYAEFAGVTAVGLIRDYANVLVTRTLSKSHALAGMRVGFGIGPAALIAALFKVKDSYNVNAASQRAAIAALDDPAHTRAIVAEIVATREWFAGELCARQWRVTPSAANFLLAAPPAGAAAWWLAALERAGFLVRHFATPRLRDQVRISMGTRAQMQALLTAIDAGAARAVTE